MELVEEHVTPNFLENETKSLRAVSRFVTSSAALADVQSSRVLCITVTLNELMQVHLLVHIEVPKFCQVICDNL